MRFMPLVLIIYRFDICADALDKNPLRTKALSSGLIGLLGDLLAQSVEWGLGGSPAPWSGAKVRVTVLDKAKKINPYYGLAVQ